MIIVRKTSHRTVFSSSWTRREQAEKLDEWQIMARKATNCGQSTRHRKCSPYASQRSAPLGDLLPR